MYTTHGRIDVSMDPLSDSRSEVVRAGSLDGESVIDNPTNTIPATRITAATDADSPLRY